MRRPAQSFVAIASLPGSGFTGNDRTRGHASATAASSRATHAGSNSRVRMTAPDSVPRPARNGPGNTPESHVYDSEHATPAPRCLNRPRWRRSIAAGAASTPQVATVAEFDLSTSGTRRSAMSRSSLGMAGSVASAIRGSTAACVIRTRCPHHLITSSPCPTVATTYEQTSTPHICDATCRRTTVAAASN